MKRSQAFQNGSFRADNSLFWLVQTLIAPALALALATSAAAVAYDWDNWTGDSEFLNPTNWRPGGGPPGALDTAIFDGQLENLGVGNNAVHVLAGTAITAMRVIDTAVVDMTIGDGTTSSRFDLDQTSGSPSLVIGDSAGDAATLNLQGGWFDTFDALVEGRASFNLINPGSYWAARYVVLYGDSITNTAGIGMGLSAQARTTTLNVGADWGSGRVVVDGTTTGFNVPALWTVNYLDVGPDWTTGFNFGQVTLQAGGQMNVQNDASVHGTSEVTSKIAVQSGGQFTVTNQLEIGPYGTFELSGSASKITTGSFTKTGSGGSFNWTAGTLEITSEHVLLDTLAPHPVLGSTLTVGAGKKFIVGPAESASKELWVAPNGTGNLIVEGGGDVESYSGLVGWLGTSHGVATVRDNGSTWSITYALNVGTDASSQGELNIQNGGSVSASHVQIGSYLDSQGFVLVNGFNSSLTSTGLLRIADSGTATGTLTIENQGTVNSSTAIIGFTGTPTGNVFVDGANSTWNNTGDIFVGNSTGGSSTLTVRNSGAVKIGGTLNFYRYGTVNLQTAGQLHADQIVRAPGGTFNTSSTTLVRTNRLTGFGSAPHFYGNLQFGHVGPTAAEHTVGAGQHLVVDQSLVVGLNAPATLLVGPGGDLRSNRAFIAAEAGSDGSTVALDGSHWFAGDSIFVGGDDAQARATGTLTVINSGQLVVTGQVRAWSTGTLFLQDSIISADAVNLSGGSLAGQGSLVLAGPLTNSGLVQAVAAAGPLSVSGTGSSYFQTAAGTLLIDFSGPGVGQFGRLSVTGSATLAGTLMGQLTVGYVPQAGNSFDILDWGTRSGTFDSVSLPMLAPGLMWNAAQLYTTGVLSVLLAGDYNGNGVVDAADYTVWRDTLGSTTDLRANGDDTGVSAGIIDQADYLAWKANFGMSADSGAVTSQNVPEPTIVVLGLFGATCILVCRTRRANPRVGLLIIAGPTAVLLLGVVHSQVLADTFGNGVSSFEIDFVTVGDPGNPDDSGTTGNWYSPFGGVGYAFRIGAYEVSRDMIAKANAEADLAITMYSYAAFGIGGGDRATRPASGVTWNEAARFVNWLNLSSGYPLAYKFAFQPGDAGYDSSANIELWQPGDAGYDANNLYRNSGAHYFLPSEDEWYKAAYYSGSGSTYFDYATQQDYPSAPAGVPGGLTSDTAVFQQNYFTGPADIDYAGGLSHYATMGQNGNVWEWIESASDGSNNNPGEPRTIRGAHWSHSVEYLRSNARLIGAGPTWRDEDWGFRVASVEEPQCLCPSIETQPQSQTVAVGSDTTFFVDISGSEPLSYQWQKDGMEMPGAIDSSLSIHDAQFGDAGNYRVMSVNPCGFALSDIASLTIVPAQLAGDYNGDSVVDAADYTIWRDTLGSSTDLRANGDNTGASAGLIDQADYDFWKSHFGQIAIGSGSVQSGAVPEPATGLLVLVGLSGLFHARIGLVFRGRTRCN